MVLYTAKGFLYSESSINGLARKFAKGLSEKYEKVYFEGISEIAEGILQFLSEIEAGRKLCCISIIYIQKRIYYQNNGSEKKIIWVVRITNKCRKEKRL